MNRNSLVNRLRYRTISTARVPGQRECRTLRRVLPGCGGLGHHLETTAPPRMPLVNVFALAGGDVDQIVEVISRTVIEAMLERWPVSSSPSASATEARRSTGGRTGTSSSWTRP